MQRAGKRKHGEYKPSHQSGKSIILVRTIIQFKIFKTVANLSRSECSDKFTQRSDCEK